MDNTRAIEQLKVVDIIERYGHCLELVTMDPNFHEITVGLYEKDGIATVWTFSQKPSVAGRIEQICDQLVNLGDMELVSGASNQVRFACGRTHNRPLKFLVKQAVEKPPDFAPTQDGVKDLRSGLMLWFDAIEEDSRWMYRITAEGEAPNKATRLRATTNGLVRYGGMEKIDGRAIFSCGYRHDALVALVLPYARNVTQVEDMLESDSLRGQMTTGTLGFTPPT